jgi:ankyrin repeat protein
MTALHHATLRGDHEMMEFLLDNGADVNSRHILLGTPICAAALRGHSKAVDVLFKYKAGLRLTHNGAIGSAMHCACFSGDIAILKMLLEHGGDLKQSSTISMLAFYDIAKEDFAPDWSPFWNRRYGSRQVKCTPVLLAAERCHFDLLDYCWIELRRTRPEFLPSLSRDPPVDPRWGFVAEEDAKCRYSPSIGTTVSTEASTTSTWSSFGFPRTASAKPRSTLLMWAAASLNLDLISYLLKNGARLDTEDANERTALHYAVLPFEEAAFKNIEKCVKRLASVKISGPTASQLLLLIVDPNHPTLDPRVMRAHGDNLQVTYIYTVMWLVDTKCVPNAAYGALCVVSRHEVYSRDVFWAILGGGVCPSSGVILWHIMDEYDPSEAVISSMLNHDASPNAFVSQWGDTVLGVAVRKRRPKAIIALLLKHGGDPDMIGENGETPRTHAKALHLDYMNELFDTSQAGRDWFLGLPSFPFGSKNKSP